jgi:hypothetical protein
VGFKTRHRNCDLEGLMNSEVYLINSTFVSFKEWVDSFQNEQKSILEFFEQNGRTYAVFTFPKISVTIVFGLMSQVQAKYEARREENFIKVREADCNFQVFDHFRGQGFRTIFMFEYDWELYSFQTKSYLKSALQINKYKIYARNCEFKEVVSSDVKELFNTYHVLRTPIFQWGVGAYLNDKLLCAASFGPHHRDHTKITLNRYVGREDYNVLGAMSKITEMAKEKYKGRGSIITWADLRWSAANGYLKTGWELKEILRPDYQYIDSQGKVTSKMSRKKDNVGTKELIGWDGVLGSMTEVQHAFDTSHYRFYDCGKVRLEIKV